MKQLIAMSLLTAFLNTPLAGEDIKTGVGGRSCGAWVTEQAVVGSDLKGMFVSWVQNYIIGYARATTMIITKPSTATLSEKRARYGTASGWIFDPPDSDALQLWVTKYCQEHPLSTTATAADGLAEELTTRALDRMNK